MSLPTTSLGDRLLPGGGRSEDRLFPGGGRREEVGECHPQAGLCIVLGSRNS